MLYLCYFQAKVTTKSTFYSDSDENLYFYMKYITKAHVIFTKPADFSYLCSDFEI